MFEQMQTQGCTPDVVTFTALISAFERSGQWHMALQAFQEMLAQGCKPDAIVYNAIIDALWQTGEDERNVNVESLQVARKVMNINILTHGSAYSRCCQHLGKLYCHVNKARQLSKEWSF
jgi:pentatricopeptide repeat protein